MKFAKKKNFSFNNIMPQFIIYILQLTDQTVSTQAQNGYLELNDIYIYIFTSLSEQKTKDKIL